MDEGLIDGPVLVVNPAAGIDLTVLPDRVRVHHDYQPDHAWFAERHDMADRIDAESGTVIVSLPRARTQARDWIARAAATGARVVVDGQKTDGAEALLKECRKSGEVGAVISKAHGKLFVLDRLDASGWMAAPRMAQAGFEVPPGGFSADGIDPGTAALLEALPALKGHVVDLGSGWGAIGRAVAVSPDITRLDMVEAHRPSLDCARDNVPDPRAAFHWADATVWSPDEKVDHVVTNPPFHRGRAGDPGLGRAFIAAAGRMLASRGVLWLVANRHLPYEGTLGEHFAETTELPGPSGFKLFRAARPRRLR